MQFGKNLSAGDLAPGFILRRDVASWPADQLSITDRHSLFLGSISYSDHFRAHRSKALHILAQDCFGDPGRPALGCGLGIKYFVVQEEQKIRWNVKPVFTKTSLELFGVQNVVSIPIKGLIELVQVGVLSEEALPNLLEEQCFHTFEDMGGQFVYIDFDASWILRSSDVQENPPDLCFIKPEVAMPCIFKRLLELFERHA